MSTAHATRDLSNIPLEVLSNSQTTQTEATFVFESKVVLKNSFHVVDSAAASTVFLATEWGDNV